MPFRDERLGGRPDRSAFVVTGLVSGHWSRIFAWSQSHRAA
jgi:hypothetical protein